MPFTHSIDIALCENAIRNRSLVKLEGINWFEGKPWIKAVLRNAGFKRALIYWVAEASPVISVDFGNHDVATRAITALDGTEANGYLLKAGLIQMTPSQFREQTSKASVPVSSPAAAIHDESAKADDSSSNMFISHVAKTADCSFALECSPMVGQTQSGVTYPATPNMELAKVRDSSPTAAKSKDIDPEQADPAKPATLRTWAANAARRKMRRKTAEYKYCPREGASIHDENSSKDTRKCQRPADIVTTNAPHKDTAKFFPRGADLFYRLFGEQPWRGGFPILEEKGWVPSDDQSKDIVSFYNPKSAAEPGFLNDNVAAQRSLIPTSRGFKIDRPVGPLNGLGWGEFDKFTEWQFQGRKVHLNMLDQNLRFCYSTGAPIHTTSPQRILTVNTTLGSPDTVDPDAPGPVGKTLLDLLRSKKERNETRDQIYGLGRRGRGGRGGRGGRAGWP
ncbi:hypothetical protein QQS21_004767 [Conoideocrella luteorostrata]|uniref:Uncharacterized protein n=1 Tax=Conoideocrella luteorostrata TaxID=1105319 RepID=A0AAJ0CQZ1_9HYPO|nr:hypothetical protein QQS21_004767 [Conoideocrella luteorostrata]